MNDIENKIVKACAILTIEPEDKIRIEIRPFASSCLAQVRLSLGDKSAYRVLTETIAPSREQAIVDLHAAVCRMVSDQVRYLNNLLGPENLVPKRDGAIEKIVSIYAALSCIKESEVSVSVRKTDNADWVWIAEIYRHALAIRTHRAKTSHEAIDGLFQQMRGFLEEEKQKLSEKIAVLQRALNE